MIHGDTMGTTGPSSFGSLRMPLISPSPPAAEPISKACFGLPTTTILTLQAKESTWRLCQLPYMSNVTTHWGIRELTLDWVHQLWDLVLPLLLGLLCPHSNRPMMTLHLLVSVSTLPLCSAILKMFEYFVSPVDGYLSQWLLVPLWEK